jgi:hypothetical protein
MHQLRAFLHYIYSIMKRFLIGLAILIIIFLVGYFSFFYAPRDHEFDEGSKIDNIKLTSQKMDDLVLLGQIWGFLKYYHPAVCKGEYNWDYELFRILPKILNVADYNERNKILTEWIERLGQVKPAKMRYKPKGKVKSTPDFSWFNKKELGNELVNLLESIKNAERPDSSYYLQLDEIGNPVFKREKVYDKNLYPDQGFRLLSIYRYWNIIQYCYPYKYLTDINWNSILKKHLPDFISAKNELQYQQAILALMTETNDSHSQIINTNPLELYKWMGRYNPPLDIRFIEGKAVLVAFKNTYLKEKSGLSIGDIIQKIDGKKIERIIQERLPYTPGSNYPAQLKYIAYRILNTEKDKLDLEISREDSVFKVSVDTHLQPDDEKDTGFSILANQVACIKPGYLVNQNISKLLPRIKESSGLIIDMRVYPKVSIVFDLSDFLLPHSKDVISFTKPNVLSPGLYEIKETIPVGKENDDFYKRKVVILVNEYTQSAGELHSMCFRLAPNAVMLGSKTTGADGDATDVYFPGGVIGRITGVGIYYPDGRETQRVGLMPDIEITPTIKGIREGKDELLEKAVELITKYQKQ